MSKPAGRKRNRGSASRRGRRQTLTEWRGVDVVPLEEARTLRARSTAQLIPELLQELRLDRRRAEAEIIKVWNHLLDPTLTAHAQPAGLHKGTLFVTVDSSAWLSEIVRYRRREMLERLQHSFGREVITRISFRVG